jgi:RHS repeat-associated protein
MLGLGGLIAKVAAAAVIPRVLKALSSSRVQSSRAEQLEHNCQKSAPERTPEIAKPLESRLVAASDSSRVSEKVLYGRYHLTAHSYRYDTYGKRTKESGDLDSDFGFAGLFHHGPSGFDLATFRTYDSAQGRWISRDPLGEGVDYNLYRYCGNDPIGNTDPDGTCPIKFKPRAVKLRDKKFSTKDHGSIFAVITFTPVYETLTGRVTLEDFSVVQYRHGILAGNGEIHVEVIRLISPPDNPRGMGIPTAVPQNSTGFMFSGAGGRGFPEGSATPVVNADMQLNFSLQAELTTPNTTYSGTGGAGTGWFHIGPGGAISPPIWGI